MEELAKKGAVGATLENTLQRLRQAAAQARIALAAAADSMDEKVPDGQHDDADAKSAMDALIRLLENDDLTALAHYAQVKHLLAAYPPAAMDRLEAALQDLDLESALAVCRGIPSSI
jgi:hypothetical protein